MIDASTHTEACTSHKLVYTRQSRTTTTRIIKGVSEKLTAEAKRKGCKDLGAWIPSLIKHLWWSAHTCKEEDAVLLKEKWLSVIHHVTNCHDWPGNRCYRCAHEPLDEESQRNELWLKPGSEAHRALVKTVTDRRLLTDLDHLSKCVRTTTLEVFMLLCV